MTVVSNAWKFAVLFGGSMTVLPATATEPPPDAVATLEAKVLECHADYVKRLIGDRYAMGLDFPGFTASEVAHAAQASCKAPMDAYAKHVLGSSLGLHDERGRAMVEQLRRYAFGYTIDRMIQARQQG
ncbi:hypothetical protein CQ393_12350 [Stenotrophomonas sp. MYb238]|uniref:hypothetical protein n=1 Tax=Stenotrophomonas sp. MYb238 TaxID=2040281 RepID=UPI0012919F9A|nr:hypothetical protein [Stenotrophomonas sp. MYb238]MQP76681.1 hypothetical protein [Stenotrophomonas sp. MYb238]